MKMNWDRWVDVLQAFVFTIIGVAFLGAVSYGCNLEHIEKMEKIKLECKK